MATVFWDVQGVILVDFTGKGITINSLKYFETLQKLRSRIRRVRPIIDVSQELLHHDNVNSHNSHQTTAAVASLGWSLLPTALTWHLLTCISSDA